MNDAVLFMSGVIFMFIMNAISDYMYRNTLVMKSKVHEVEFINGEPIVLMPERDYIDMVFTKDRQ
jgi:hypothetical protein